MNNSYYSIGLQRLKPVHTAYCGLHNLAENWYCARDVNGRDRDETEKSAFRDRDVDNFSRDETLVRLETVSRPRRRDRDHNPALSFDSFPCNDLPCLVSSWCDYSKHLCQFRCMSFQWFGTLYRVHKISMVVVA